MPCKVGRRPSACIASVVCAALRAARTRRHRRRWPHCGLLHRHAPAAAPPPTCPLLAHRGPGHPVGHFPFYYQQPAPLLRMYPSACTTLPPFLQHIIHENVTLPINRSSLLDNPHDAMAMCTRDMYRTHSLDSHMVTWHKIRYATALLDMHMT